MTTNYEAGASAVAMMTSVLRNIASDRDCDYQYTEDRPDPCNCPHCAAVHALAITTEWRYVGAKYDRATTLALQNPREAKMHASWKREVDDSLLGKILNPGESNNDVTRVVEIPSGRDWYVATSVVQWLATNVGRSVLEGAGFKYTFDDEDYARRRARDEDMPQRIVDAGIRMGKMRTALLAASATLAAAAIDESLDDKAVAKAEDALCMAAVDFAAERDRHAKLKLYMPAEQTVEVGNG